MKRLVLVLTFLFFAATSVLAVNTTLVGESGKSIEITGLDADWIWTTALTGETSAVSQSRIKAIVFYPSAANDRMIIRDGTIDEAAVYDSGLASAATDPRIMYYNPALKSELVIDITDCTLSVAGNAKVIIFLE